jgi:hypothetical protein
VRDEPRPKARYLVGVDAKAGALMARMPDRVFERLMAMNAERLEKLGRGEERTDGYLRRLGHAPG